MAFVNYAAYAQDLKGIIREAPTWGSMSDTQRECLENIASSLAHIIVDNNNDPGDWNNLAISAKLAMEDNQWHAQPAKTATNTNQKKTGPTGPAG